MPRASDHQSSSITKLLYIGDSGTGKTTSLWSLVAAGYRLRILDFDNLLDSLVAKVRRECPDKLDNIEFMSFRDKMKATPLGPVVDGQPAAFVNALRALDKWEDGSKPADWGPETICVVDSGTTCARSAYWWGKGMQGAASFAEGVAMKGYDPRQAFFTAQQAYMNLISLLTSPSFNTNVIWISHVKYLEQDGATKGFPVAIGSAISPEIPSYFASVALATKTNGSTPKRMIRTQSTNMIDLKNPKSFDTVPELPMETGLADFFKAQRG